MPASVFENLSGGFERFSLAARPPGDTRPLRVLEITEADLGETAERLFARHDFSRLIAPAGEPASLTLPQAPPFDAIFLHRPAGIARARALASLALRQLAPDGYLYLIAAGEPPGGDHLTLPDTGAFAHAVGGHLLQAWQDRRAPLHEIAAVIARHPGGVPHPAHPPAKPPPPAIAPATDADPPDLREKRSGAVNYIELLKAIQVWTGPKLYLEIGIRNGKSLSLARGDAVGVDPMPDITFPLGHQTRVFTETSDGFFRDGSARVLNRPVDLAFIDGMHLYEFALRDFMNVERACAPGALVMMDDIFPNHPAQARRLRETNVWMGDVWRVLPALAQLRPDLLLVAVDTYPSGLLLVAGLNPEDDTLWRSYNDLMAAGPPEQEPPLPSEYLRRQGAVSPTEPVLHEFIRNLAGWARTGLDRAALLEKIAPYRTSLSLFR